MISCSVDFKFNAMKVCESNRGAERLVVNLQLNKLYVTEKTITVIDMKEETLFI